MDVRRFRGKANREEYWNSLNNTKDILTNLQNCVPDRKMVLVMHSWMMTFARFIKDRYPIENWHQIEECLQGIESRYGNHEVINDIHSRYIIFSSEQHVPSLIYRLSVLCNQVAMTRTGEGFETINRIYPVVKSLIHGDIFLGKASFDEILYVLTNPLKDVLGNPFDPVKWEDKWQTSTTIGLAKGIYQEKAFDRMPILADSLEDAGCNDERILSHCRGYGYHIRGCWVVDSILGQHFWVPVKKK